MKIKGIFLIFLMSMLLKSAADDVSWAYAGEDSHRGYREAFLGTQLIKCEHVPKTSKTALTDQLILWFTKPCAYELSVFNKNAFTLTFKNIDPNDFLTTKVAEKCAAMNGVADASLSYNENTCSITVNYDPALISFKFNSPPGAAYLKIDGFVFDKVKNNVATLPSKHHRIVIDAGHGGDDWGAVGIDGIKEKDITLDMARRLYRLLKESGYDVRLIRDEDIFVSIEDKIERLQFLEGTFFICMHANYSPNPAIKRIELYPRFSDVHATDRYLSTDEKEARLVFEAQGNDKTEESFKIAEIMRGVLAESLEAHPPLYQGERAVSNVKTLRNNPLRTLLLSPVPALLVEVGYITNRVEATILKSSEYRNLLVQAIKKALDSYFL